ncbi:MAG: hypothetical protein HC767_13130 [Akkermansiaceae bacterium]|nr:hypothetical protein [Akkermansiaceae bacterium]
MRFAVAAVLTALFFSNVSCMTTYDYEGRPIQTVDPAVAVAGVAAAGLIGYAAGNNHGRHHGGYHGGYHRGGYYAPCY